MILPMILTRPTMRMRQETRKTAVEGSFETTWENHTVEVEAMPQLKQGKFSKHNPIATMKYWRD